MSEGMLLPEANIAIDRRGLFTRAPAWRCPAPPWPC